MNKTTKVLLLVFLVCFLSIALFVWLIVAERKKDVSNAPKFKPQLNTPYVLDYPSAIR